MDVRAWRPGRRSWLQLLCGEGEDVVEQGFGVGGVEQGEPDVEDPASCFGLCVGDGVSVIVTVGAAQLEQGDML